MGRDVPGLRAKLASKLPRPPDAMHRRRKLLPQLLFDHRFPRHQAEPHAVIKHGVAPAGEHDAPAIDAGHALSIGYRSMLQAGFGGNVFRSEEHTSELKSLMRISYAVLCLKKQRYTQCTLYQRVITVRIVFG